MSNGFNAYVSTA